MTKKLYWEDSYLKEFEAEVIDINENRVILDRTAFFIQGGGEPGDIGELNGIRVTNTVPDESGNGMHILEKEPNFNVGDKVKGIIDWDRRYRLMKMHTASHLLSAIIHKETGALISGGNLDLDKSRIDFNLEKFDREKFTEYVEKANELIKQGAEVKSYFMKRKEAMKIPGIVKLLEALPPNLETLRIVEIEGIDIQADGGNHVKNLKELGNIEIVKLENKGKNNRRLYFTLNLS